MIKEIDGVQRVIGMRVPGDLFVKYRWCSTRRF